MNNMSWSGKTANYWNFDLNHFCSILISKLFSCMYCSMKKKEGRKLTVIHLARMLANLLLDGGTGDI